VRRWSRHGFLALAVLLILLAVLGLVIQIILTTDWPRRRVIRSLEDATGLGVDAASLDIGWSGRSTLRDVVFRLPLSDQPLIRVPTVRVRHSSIPAVLSGARVEVRDLVLERPHAWVLEERPGEWNILVARDQIVSIQAQRAATEGAAALPHVLIDHGTLDIRRADGRTVTLPLDAEGTARGRLVWEFSASLGDDLRLTGKVSPHAQWAHEIEFDVRSARAVASLFVAHPPEPLLARGSWSGASVPGGVNGWLTLGTLQIAGLSVTGMTGLRTSPAGAEFRPSRMSAIYPGAPNLTLTGGSLRLGPAGTAWTALNLEGGGVGAMLSGSWDPGGETIRVAATWRGANAGKSITHEGSGEATLAMPRLGRLSLDLSARSRGSAGAASWDARTTVALSGKDWRSLGGEIRLPAGTFRSGERELDLSGLAASFTSDWPALTLTRLDLPSATSTRARATLDASTSKWDLTLSASDLDLSDFTGEPISVLLRASGDRSRLDFSRLVISGPTIEVRAAGNLIPSRQDALVATGDFWYSTPRTPAPESLEDEARPASVWTGDGSVKGGLWPPSLTIDARARGRQVPIGRTVVEQIDVPLHASITEEGLRVSASEISLLGGVWRMDARYERALSYGEAQLAVSGADLGAVGNAVLPALELSGKLDSEVLLRLPNMDRAKLQLEGGWTVRDLKTPGGDAESARGRLSATGETLTLSDIAVARGKGSLSGSVELNLADERRVRIQAHARRWPVELRSSPVTFLVDSDVNVSLNTRSRRATGSVGFAADALHNGSPVGRLESQLRLTGRTIEATSIRADLAGGIARGSATISLDDWTKSTGKLEMADIQLPKLADWLPQTLGLGGVLTGTIQAGPAPEPEAYGPLRIDLLLSGAHLAYRELSFQELRSSAYLAPRHILVDESQVLTAGGTVRYWGRLSYHGKDPFVHVSASGRDLSLDQIVRSARPETGETPGKVSFNANAGGYIFHPHRAYGAALVDVTESDLGRLPVVSQIYTLLHINAATPAPTGRTRAVFRLDGDSLELTRLHHFNRGVDILASLTVENVWLGADSPIQGVAAGGARPLRDLKVPFGSELDRLLRGLQSNAVSVVIGGTLGRHITRVVPFSEVGQAVGRLLGVPER
jgi:hypothetical protein